MAGRVEGSEHPIQCIEMPAMTNHKHTKMVENNKRLFTRAYYITDSYLIYNDTIKMRNTEKKKVHSII